MLPDDRSKKAVDVVIGREFTEIVGEAKVAASLASPSPSTSGPGCAAAALIAPVDDPTAEASGVPTPALTPSASTIPAEG
jgi:hypothetical protein